jgi:rsbT co-antagonist protein RsbR
MSERYSIAPAEIPLEWDVDEARFSFLGRPSIALWDYPSLFHLLAPLVEELGSDLFRLTVARSSSIGTEEDYHAMVTVLGSTFEEGFKGWCRAALVAGWGIFTLEAFDRAAGTARVRAINPFELRAQKEGGRSWGCPYLMGKFIGVFRHALGQSCWAEEDIHTSAGRLEAVFHIHPSNRTLDDELAALRKERRQAEQAALERRVEEATVALLQQREEILLRDRLIRSLSTPIIQVWDGVLVVPLVGELSSERADQLNADLLARVISQSASHVVLDLTGLSCVDSAMAERLGSTVAAVRLVGAACAVVGLSPAFAQAMVALGVSFGGVRTLRTLADALREVVGLVRRERQSSSPDARSSR